jgi:competence protein ComEC
MGMGAIALGIWGIAYLLGLLSTGMAWGIWIMAAAAIGLAIALPRLYRKSPKRWVCLVAGAIAIAASFYLQIRTPQPTAQDISRWIPAESRFTPITVQGVVETVPRQTRSGKAQVWLTVQQVDANAQPNSAQPNSAQPNSAQPAQAKQDGKASQRAEGKLAVGKLAVGKLYVTLPLLQATGLQPGLKVQITGSLYQPSPATNPGGFDFQQYLAREGCFAGLTGTQVEIPAQNLAWGLWRVQRQIVRSQIVGAGSPLGQLISSMALGKEAVDLPFDVKDAFSQVGLAHALAASGFQISLILEIVLVLTRRFPERIQVVAGAVAIASFVLLAGFEPAILRAACMGAATLVALLLGRKVKPLGALLAVAVLLLLYNPLWIWDLGFQLSFFATLGLLVTVPTLSKQLDWLPTAIASLIAVPLAAYLWTLPLQLYVFGIVSPYSIPANILTAPLISVISLGGMASAIAALIWSPLGSAIAWALQYPAGLLLAIVQTAAQLPGNAYAVGAISGLMVGVLYGLLGLMGFHRWWKSRWWVVGLLGTGLVLMTSWQARASLFQVSALATKDQPVLVVQEAGRTAVINPADPTITNLTLLPFLQKQGVNHLDWAIAASPRTKMTWEAIQTRLPIAQFVDHPAIVSPSSGSFLSSTVTQNHASLILNQTMRFGSSQVQLLSTAPSVVKFMLGDRAWLWLDEIALPQQATLTSSGTVPQVDVLWWSGKPLTSLLLNQIKPKIAIASASKVDEKTAIALQKLGTQLYCTGRDGAIQWTPKTGFNTTLTRTNDPL